MPDPRDPLRVPFGSPPTPLLLGGGAPARPPAQSLPTAILGGPPPGAAPLAPTPLWQRAANLAGVPEALAQVSAAAGMVRDWIQVVQSGAHHWLQSVESMLPPATPPSPEALARYTALGEQWQAERAEKARAWPEAWERLTAAKHAFDSEPVQQTLKDTGAASLWTPAPEITATRDWVQSQIAARTAERRAALQHAGLPAGLDFEAPRADWLPSLATDVLHDSMSPLGMAMNVDFPVGPVTKGVGAVAHAGMLPGFFSRVDRVIEAVPKTGIHPNKLASQLKSGASAEEVGFRRLNELIAGAGNRRLSKAELEAHLAAHPPPEVTRTVLGDPNPARVTALPEGYSIQPVRGPGQLAARSYHTLVDPSGVGRVLHADTPEDALDEALSLLSRGQPLTLPTKYSSYTLPGGESYREALTQLPDPTAARRAALEEERYLLAQHVDFRSPDTTRQELDALIARHDAKQAEIDALPPPTTYVSSHFPEHPNLLVHARTTERTLPGPAGPPVPPFVEPAPGALAAEGWTVRIDREDPYTGTRQMTVFNPEGEWAGSRGMTRLTPDEYLHETAVDRAKTAYKQTQIDAVQPTGPRGQFIEELQSDLNQQGKKLGYADPVADSRDLHNAGATLRQAEIDHAARLREITGGQLTAGEVNFLSQASEVGDTIEQVIARIPERAHWHPPIEGNVPEFQARARGWLEWRGRAGGHRSPVSTAWSGMNALRQTEEAVNEARAAYQTLRQRQMSLVPDLPFKETWTDLALKQQLLDVAHRRDLSWLGLSRAKTHVDRYGTERLTWAPEGAGFRVRWEPQVGGDALGGDLDLGEEALARGLITNADKYVDSPEALARLLGTSDVKADKAWKRIQAQPAGGTYLPRAEGMQAYYDEFARRRLEKLVGRHGGTVESVPLRGRSRTQIDAEMDALTEAALAEATEPPNYREALARLQVERNTATDDSAWIARLSPETLESIRTKGFDLMSFLPPALVGGGAAAAGAASQAGGEGGGGEKR